MKIFVAGATGVLGRSAVRTFLAAGHQVTGVARTDEKAATLRAQGADPTRIDVFDTDALTRVVAGHDAVCNFATHIPSSAKLLFRSAWRENDKLHRDGSRVLVDAALAAGASIFMQHSSGFMYTDGGAEWLDEDAPRDPPPHGLSIFDAESSAARFAASGANGIALRFGFFYGPDAGTTRDQLRMARAGVCPTPGKPDAFYPSIHTADLGTAAVAALAAPSGNYNVTDDEPLTRQDIANVVAKALGRKRLRVMPMPMRRLGYIARSQRVSSKRFKEATGWKPAYSSSRTGWPDTINSMSA